MTLDEAVRICEQCPSKHEPAYLQAHICGDCPLNNGIMIGNQEADTWIPANLCRLFVTIECTLRDIETGS